VAAVFGTEEAFLVVPVGAGPVGGVTPGVPDRLPFAMNLISADAIWSGVAVVVTPRDDASVGGCCEQVIPSETEPSL
jgi:hypothetical protein